MEKILPEYERASGRHVEIEYGASAALKRTIEGGQAFDLAILTPTVIDDLINENKITAGTHTDVARSDLGVGIRAGAPRSDISTADALKRRLLAATSITYATKRRDRRLQRDDSPPGDRRRDRIEDDAADGVGASGRERRGERLSSYSRP